jgi:hypothetical protein
MEYESKFDVLVELQQQNEKLKKNCDKLEKCLQEKDEKICELQDAVSFYKEELEIHQQIQNRKLMAYDSIWEM